jgi:predicted membrane channel-forming protein YqfA (hemolysin III family)
MPDRTHRVDGFAICSGLAAIATGPALLARGGPAGWSFLLIATGLVLVVTQWVIASDMQFDLSDRVQVLTAVIGMACVAIAVVYLTRAANDLPRQFPGHDGDSEHFRVVSGVLTLTVGVVLFGRGVAASHPTRAQA